MSTNEIHSPRKAAELELAQFSSETKVIGAVSKIALESFQGIGFFSGGIEPDPKPLNSAECIGSWCSIFGLKHHLWMDVIIEAQLEDTEHAFQAITGLDASTKADAYDLLGEMANFVRGGIRRVMSADGEESLTPGTPKEIPGGNLHSTTHYPCAKVTTHLKSDDFRVVVTVLINRQVPFAKTLGMLREFDITLEAIPTRKGSTLEVLAKGVALSSAWIEKLRSRYMQEPTERRITVVTPPAVTHLFHPKFL